MTVEELLEIEEIRSLRSAYSACLDSGDIAALADLFCEDATCEFPQRFGGRCVGRDAIVNTLAERMNAAPDALEAIHVVTNPWITLTGPYTARGHCYLIDLLGRQHAATARPTGRDDDGNPLLSLGRYEDDYRKVDGAWKFAAIRRPYFWADPATEKLTG